MSALASKLLFALWLILGLRRAVFEERGGGPARLVGVGTAYRGRGFLRESALVTAKAGLQMKGFVCRWLKAVSHQRSRAV